jgi:ketosteroid isomerase-like protein
MKQSKELTQAEMEAVLWSHEEAEHSADLETIMSTVSDDPHYELVSIGWKVDGRDAVREMYRRMNVTARDSGPNRARSTKRVHAVGPNTLVREAYLYFTKDNERAAGRYAVVLTFDDGKISGERMYLDPDFAAMLGQVLGDDFGNVPGVTRI